MFLVEVIVDSTVEVHGTQELGVNQPERETELYCFVDETPYRWIRENLLTEKVVRDGH